jgi:hypothetical protein
MTVPFRLPCVNPRDEKLLPLFDYINERHAIYLRKAMLTGPAPELGKSIRAKLGTGWTADNLTDDAVLRAHRFCNVFRELDRVTIWIREHIREPYADHPHLWFMLCMARWINWPDTLGELMDSKGGWPSQRAFSCERVTQILEARARRGEKVFTGAYKIDAGRGGSKPKHVAEAVLGGVWRNPVPMRATLQGTWEAFQPRIGWGPFMAYEAVTDLRHTRYLNAAPDIMRWANAGPGAMRGINRLRGEKLTAAMTPVYANSYIRYLLEMSQNYPVLAPWVPPLEMRDIEHSLCEVDKYLRVRDDGGTTRASYVPGRGH